LTDLSLMPLSSMRGAVPATSPVSSMAWSRTGCRYKITFTFYMLL